MKRILCSMFTFFLLMGLSGNAMAQNPFFLTITGDDESYSMFINNGKVIHGIAETPEQREIVSGAYDGADLQFTIVNDDLSDCDQWLTHNFEICESEVILRTTVDKCGNVLTDINKIYSASIVNIVTEQDSPTAILGPQKGYEVENINSITIILSKGSPFCFTSYDAEGMAEECCWEE